MSNEPTTLKRKYYPESAIGDFTYIDGTIAFYLKVTGLLQPEDLLLDVGCGRGAGSEGSSNVRKELRTLRGKCKRVIGIDVDSEGATNPSLDEFRLITDNHWPVESHSVSVIVSDYVLEHIENVDQFFAEAARVLIPGGYLCIRTPNKYSYISLLTRMIPERRHIDVLARVQSMRQERDVFPKLFLCNSVRALRRAFARNGFEGIITTFESEPQYLEFSRFCYLLGVLYQRVAPSYLRSNIFAFAQAGSTKLID